MSDHDPHQVPAIPMTATWSPTIAANVTGDSCRYCGKTLVDGRMVYLGLKRPSKLVLAYCSWEHWDIELGTGAVPS
jgi:hypothetical protein